MDGSRASNAAGILIKAQAQSERCKEVGPQASETCGIVVRTSGGKTIQLHEFTRERISDKRRIRGSRRTPWLRVLGRQEHRTK